MLVVNFLVITSSLLYLVQVAVSGAKSTKYFYGNYEKKVLPNGNITEYYYLGGEGGLATVYIKTTAGSSTTSALYGILTDHLGNINGLISTDCKIADACMYDPCSRLLQTRQRSAAGLASNRNPDEYKRNRETLR